MSGVAKLRLIHLGYGLSTLGALASFFPTFFLGETITIEYYGVTTVYRVSDYTLLPPQTWLTLSIITLVLCTCLYVWQYQRVSQAEIDAANQRTIHFVVKNWWKILLVMLAMSWGLVEFAIWYFDFS